MKPLPIFLAYMLCVSFAHAQTTDSIDNLILRIPASWQVNRQATYMQLTTFSKDRFCQLTIYQKQPATAHKAASFEKEWSDLVLASFQSQATTVLPEAKKTMNGHSVLRFGAMAVSRGNNSPYYVELNMYDCGNSVQSAIVVSGSKEHLRFFDSSWQLLVSGVKTSETQGVTAAKSPFSGYWGKSSSSASNSSMATNAGYFKNQYNFKPDGTYILHAETWGGYMSSNDYTVIDEKGSYAVIEKQLVLMPAKSTLAHTDRNGKVKKTENLDISRRTYTWQLHYFEGINETNLVLTPVKDYLHDGGYSSNSLFPNAYLLSQDYKPEWKITLK